MSFIGPLSRMVGSAIIWVLTVLAVVGGSEARDCNQEVQAYQNMISAFLGSMPSSSDLLEIDFWQVGKRQNRC